MALFSKAQIEKINAIAAKSTEAIEQPKKVANAKSINDDLQRISKQVIDYFQGAESELITTVEQLHEYIDKCIEAKYVGYDTETTGLDRIHDTIVGFSLYCIGQHEVYIPIKHKAPVIETLYKGQLTYEECQPELQRLVDAQCRMIMANADFDIAMTYKDMHVDFKDTTYYDVILAWRCIKENEVDNSLKGLYAKYPKRGQVDPKKFSDFFPVELYPYSRPEVAKFYAANDAKITVELFLWQLPYVTKNSAKCNKNDLGKIADIVWNIEFPMIAVCAELHRTGMYIEKSISDVLKVRYAEELAKEERIMADMVDKLIAEKDTPYNSKRPFASGKDFNPGSSKPALYMLTKLLGLDVKSSGKEAVEEYTNIPEVAQLLKVRSLRTVINTFVQKMPNAAGADGRIHGRFNSVGASTGRMCIAEFEHVWLADGSTKPIKDIVPGDFVLTFTDDGKITQKRVLNKWLTFNNAICYSIWTTSGISIRCTRTHPFMVIGEGWKSAGQLVPGDLIRGISDIDTEVNYEVQFTQETDNRYDVYDIEIADSHNFIVNRLNVHNSSAEPNMQNIPSHRTDIRHMFRATPQTTEIIETTENNGKIQLTLFRADSVILNNGNRSMVEELKISDSLRSTNDQGEDTILIITDISEIDKFGNIIITLEEENNVK